MPQSKVKILHLCIILLNNIINLGLEMSLQVSCSLFLQFGFLRSLAYFFICELLLLNEALSCYCFKTPLEC